MPTTIEELIENLKRKNKEEAKRQIERLNQDGLSIEGLFEWIYKMHFKKEWGNIDSTMTSLFSERWQSFTNKKEDQLLMSLPPYVEKDLRELIAIRNGKSDEPIDCVWGEVYGSLNSAQWDFEMSVEVADYFRRAYLGIPV